ncbi:MAG: hypothetical protein BMS9Abin04_312 [Planctomycetia bacterium]|nr:MAG: hypothetical protein BMS9Abin04_312 [Planctomycetia bacterium]
MRTIIWLLIAGLILLHQDNWFWDDTTLVGRFVPIGLFYHACLSVAAGVTWYLATKYCWPVQEPAGPQGQPPADGQDPAPQ